MRQPIQGSTKGGAAKEVPSGDILSYRNQHQRVTDGRWIASLCLARVGFALIFVAYSASLRLLKQDWGLSSAQAGLIQSSWHAGYPSVYSTALTELVPGHSLARCGAGAAFWIIQRIAGY